MVIYIGEGDEIEQVRAVALGVLAASTTVLAGGVCPFTQPNRDVIEAHGDTTDRGLAHIDILAVCIVSMQTAIDHAGKEILDVESIRVRELLQSATIYRLP